MNTTQNPTAWTLGHIQKRKSAVLANNMEGTIVTRSTVKHALSTWNQQLEENSTQWPSKQHFELELVLKPRVRWNVKICKHSHWLSLCTFIHSKVSTPCTPGVVDAAPTELMHCRGLTHCTQNSPFHRTPSLTRHLICSSNWSPFNTALLARKGCSSVSHYAVERVHDRWELTTEWPAAAVVAVNFRLIGLDFDSEGPA